MKPNQAERYFIDMLAQHGKSLSELTPSEGIHFMLTFYRQLRADNCELESDGDMLLYQWWASGSSIDPYFTIDISRQFIDSTNNDGDDVMSALALSFEYQLSPEFDAITDGNRWCDTPEDIDDFFDFITSSEAYRKFKTVPAVKVTLDYSLI